jgi:hypothetical protein
MSSKATKVSRSFVNSHRLRARCHPTETSCQLSIRDPSVTATITRRLSNDLSCLNRSLLTAGGDTVERIWITVFSLVGPGMPPARTRSAPLPVNPERGAPSALQ